MINGSLSQRTFTLRNSIIYGNTAADADADVITAMPSLVVDIWSWFKVDYHGAKGWISAAYVEPIGTCG